MNQCIEALNENFDNLKERHDANLHFSAVVAEDIEQFICENREKIVDCFVDNAYCFVFIRGLPSSEYLVDNEDDFFENEYGIDGDNRLLKDLYLENGDVNKDLIVGELNLKRWDGKYYTYEGNLKHISIPGVVE